MNTCRKIGEGWPLIIRVVGRQKGVLRAKVILAANVYQQDELRGVKEVIRSFRALTRPTPLLPHKNL